MPAALFRSTTRCTYRPVRSRAWLGYCWGHHKAAGKPPRYTHLRPLPPGESMVTRRLVLQTLGSAALASAVSAAQTQATFPAGAIIRTLFRDYRPDELA